MNLFRKITLGATLMAIVTAGAIGCGGSDGVTSFTIFPSTATVERGSTFQFDTNPMGLLDVTWTVVGGATNGTIDADGLYTAPADLPVENTVTIEAERDGFTATGTVTLVAADTLSFGSTEQVSDTSVINAALLYVFFGGVGDQLGVGSGSVHVYSSWTSVAGGNPDVSFSSALDLGAFAPETNLTNTASAINNSMIVDQDLDPGIFFTTGLTGGLQFLGSSNQGASFNPPVPVVSPASGNAEAQADGAVDQDNNYHLVFLEDAATNVIKFTSSTNQGAAWSAPIPVSVSANDQFAPQVAVSADGQDVFVCYSESIAGNFDVFVALSNNGGSSFTTANITNSAGVEDLFCNIALGPNGEVYLAYSSDGGDGNILFQSSTNGGSSFNPPVTVNSSTASDQALSYLAVDSQGRIDMVWGDQAGTSTLKIIQYARSLDGGATFTPNVAIGGGGAAQLAFPMGIGHDDSDRLHVQFASDVNSPGVDYDIFYVNGQ